MHQAVLVGMHIRKFQQVSGCDVTWYDANVTTSASRVSLPKLSHKWLQQQLARQNDTLGGQVPILPDIQG